MTRRIDYFGKNEDGDFSFLSNFYADHDGAETLEHFYQAAKTDSPEWIAKILLAKTPAEAKKLGRNAPLRATWDSEKIAVMRALLLMKFNDNALAIRLLQTGDAELVEGNNWGDTFWGQVYGHGENWLGTLLMEVREVLRIATALTDV